MPQEDVEDVENESDVKKNENESYEKKTPSESGAIDTAKAIEEIKSVHVEQLEEFTEEVAEEVAEDGSPLLPVTSQDSVVVWDEKKRTIQKLEERKRRINEFERLCSLRRDRLELEKRLEDGVISVEEFDVEAGKAKAEERQREQEETPRCSHVMCQ